MSSERTIYPTKQSEKNYVDIDCRNSLKRTYFLSAERNVYHRGESRVSPRRDICRIAEEQGKCIIKFLKGNTELTVPLFIEGEFAKRK